MIIAKTNPLTIKPVFHREKDGGYWVEVPSLKGCCSQGDTLDEARKNIQEAIKLYLEDVHPRPHLDFPPSSTKPL